MTHDIPNIEEQLEATLHGLVRQSISDIRSILEARGQGYTVNFDAWHEPRNNSRCHVGMAGVLIARRLQQPKDKYRTPRMFNRATHDRLAAVNLVRLGCLGSAAHTLYREAPLDPELYASGTRLQRHIAEETEEDMVKLYKKVSKTTKHYKPQWHFSQFPEERWRGEWFAFWKHAGDLLEAKGL